MGLTDWLKNQCRLCWAGWGLAALLGVFLLGTVRQFKSATSAANAAERDLLATLQRVEAAEAEREREAEKTASELADLQVQLERFRGAMEYFLTLREADNGSTPNTNTTTPD